MNDRNQRHRDGNTAPSVNAARISLGDIDDLRAYVAKIVGTISDDPNEFDELLSEGLLLAWQRSESLAPGDSLQQSLAGWLESRLRDYWRKQHPERRRNSRAGTNYTFGAPTALAWEHDPSSDRPQVSDERAIVDSRLALELFTSEADLRDPRAIGRYLRVPSHAGLATGQARDIWAACEEERALSDRQPFAFHKNLD